MSEENKTSKFDLSSLSPQAGSTKKAKRVGRGNASGWGRTAGKGEKGQKARAGGGVPAWFEGGSLPYYRKIPKIGFKSRKQMLGTNAYTVVNFDVLNKFNDGETVDLEALKIKGYSSSTKRRAGVKLLARGTLEKKLTVKVNAASASAVKVIEELGGSVEIL